MGLLRGIERLSILLFLVFGYRVVFLESFFSQYSKLYQIFYMFSSVRSSRKLLSSKAVCQNYIFRRDNSVIFLLLHTKRCKSPIQCEPFKLSCFSQANNLFNQR